MTQSAALARMPGIMTGAEFEARVAEFAAPSQARLARREALRWKGVNVEVRDGLFSVAHGFDVRHELKAAGFRWNADYRTWETDSPTVVSKCPELVRKAKGEARASLKDVLRLQVAGDTFERAQSRLAEGDIERVKKVLDKEMAEAIRSGVALLSAADDDRAAVRNASGWSKAHSELGHTLALTGITNFRQAALALKLLWPYRAQLPADVVAAAFPVHCTGREPVEEEVSPAEAELTTAQAQELLAMPISEVIQDIMDSTVAILGAPLEPDLSKPPFMRETRQSIARVEGGATLLVVTRGKKTLRLEVRLAA